MSTRIPPPVARRETPTRRGSRSVLAAVALLVLAALAAWSWRDLCLWRADVLLTTRKTEAAQRWLARSAWLGSSVDGRSLLLQIRAARRLGDFALVEKLLRDPASAKIKPADLNRERWLAMAQTNQFQNIQAVWPGLLNDPRDDGPEIAKAYYTWSMLNHNISAAQQTLELWQADYPNDAEPFLLAGKFYEAMVNWRLAEENYRKGAALAPNDLSARIAWGNSLRILLKTDEAEAVYRQCLKLDPSSIEAVRGLAQCLSTKGDFTGAAVLLKEALDRHPEDFGLLKDYGETLLAGGDAEPAVEVLRRALEQVPEHANLAYSLAKALKATGRGAEAEPLMAFVSESRVALERMNQLEHQLRNSPRDLALRMELAALTAKYVSRQDAIGWYRQLLGLAPGYEPARQAMEALQRELANSRPVATNSETKPD